MVMFPFDLTWNTWKDHTALGVAISLLTVLAPHDTVQRDLDCTSFTLRGYSQLNSESTRRQPNPHT